MGITMSRNGSGPIVAKMLTRHARVWLELEDSEGMTHSTEVAAFSGFC